MVAQREYWEGTHPNLSNGWWAVMEASDSSRAVLQAFGKEAEAVLAEAGRAPIQFFVPASHPMKDYILNPANGFKHVSYNIKRGVY